MLLVTLTRCTQVSTYAGGSDAHSAMKHQSHIHTTYFPLQKAECKFRGDHMGVTEDRELS